MISTRITLRGVTTIRECCQFLAAKTPLELRGTRSSLPQEVGTSDSDQHRCVHVIGDPGAAEDPATHPLLRDRTCPTCAVREVEREK